MRVLLSLLVFSLFCAPAEAVPLDVDGTWVAHNRDGQIETHVTIRDCGDGTPCGTLVWLDPEAASRRTLDERNPDRSMRGRPLIGTTVLSRFERNGDVWRGGRLYNPEDGMSFDCAMTRLPDGRLRVTGCLGPLCQTNIWRRAGND